MNVTVPINSRVSLLRRFNPFFFSATKIIYICCDLLQIFIFFNLSLLKHVYVFPSFEWNCRKHLFSPNQGNGPLPCLVYLLRIHFYTFHLLKLLILPLYYPLAFSSRICFYSHSILKKSIYKSSFFFPLSQPPIILFPPVKRKILIKTVAYLGYSLIHVQLPSIPNLIQ